MGLKSTGESGDLDGRFCNPATCALGMVLSCLSEAPAGVGETESAALTPQEIHCLY